MSTYLCDALTMQQIVANMRNDIILIQRRANEFSLFFIISKSNLIIHYVYIFLSHKRL